MILDGDDVSAAGTRGGGEGFAVDGADAEQVDDADRDALLLKVVIGSERFENGDTAGDDQGAVAVARAEHFALSQSKRFVGGIEDRGITASEADVAGAFGFGEQAGAFPGGGGVGGIEDCEIGFCADHGDVFEAHHGGAVLADGDADVGAGELDVEPADGGDADEVVSAGEEAGEGRGEGDFAAAGEAHCHAEDVLLGDVAFQEAVRGGFFEVLGVGGVFDVAIEDDDAGVGGTEGGESFGEGFAGGDGLLTGGVGGIGGGGGGVGGVGVGGFGACGGGLGVRGLGGVGGIGFGGLLAGCGGVGGGDVWGLRVDVGRWVRGGCGQRVGTPIGIGAGELAFELGDDFIGEVFGKGFTVPAVLVLDVIEAFAFDGAGEDYGGAAGGLAGGFVGGEELGDVVAVDDEGLPAEGFPALAVDLHVVLEHGGLALAEAVDVDGGAEVIEVVERGPLGGFPDGAFGGFAIAHE